MITKDILLQCLGEGVEVLDEDNGEYIFVGEDVYAELNQLSESDLSELSESCDSLNEDEIAESAGVLSGLPKHIIKSITNRYQPGMAPAGGENSEVSVEHVKAKTAAHVAISKGLADNKHVVIKKDGKVLASIHPANYSGEKPSNFVQKGEEPGAVTKETSKWVKSKMRRGQYEPGYAQKRTEHRLGRADAINHVHAAVEAAGGYKSGVEVHHVGQDANRIAKAKERSTNRDGYVTNSVYDSKSQSYKGTVNNGQGKASDPKSLAAVTKRAAERIANKYDDGRGPKAKAMEHHAAIGKAIEAGDYKEMRKHMDALANHVHQHGMNKDSYDKDRVVDTGVSLGKRASRAKGGYNYDRDAFVNSVRKLKGLPEKDRN